MSKKNKGKKKGNKDTREEEAAPQEKVEEEQKTEESTDEQKPKKKKGDKKSYKRGDLGKAINMYFDKVGVDNATYDKSLEIARSIIPDTKFNKYHFSWYKNKYAKKQLDAGK